MHEAVAPPIRVLDDNPAISDGIGFASLADLLVDVIESKPTLPFTIGVFGEWGSGKTTLMRLIQERLTAKTVWFNAWKYDGKEAVWNAFIQQIFRTMLVDPEVKEQKDRERFRRRVVTAARGLGLYAAKVATRAIPGALVRDEDLDALAAAFRSSADDELFEFVNRFEDVFGGLVSEFVGKDGYLVVFVDDLDRCLPENAVAVMEALKLYLDSSSCVFVIGVEPTIVEEGIRQRYRSDRISPVEYIEKIVQLPVAVPRPARENALALLPEDGASSFVRGDKALERLLERGTDANPRRIKRFVNSFAIVEALERGRRGGGGLSDDERRVLAKVLLVQIRFPAVFRALQKRPSLLRKVAEGHEKSWNAEKWLGQGLGEFQGDVVLQRFLDKTKEISVRDDDVKPWIRLASGTGDDDLEELDSEP